VSLRLKTRLGLLDPIHIVPYRGFGNADRMTLMARVLEDKGIEAPGEDDDKWDNLLNAYRRFASDEIHDVRVRLAFKGTEQVEPTDDDGFARFVFAPSEPLPGDRLWHEVELELLDDDLLDGVSEGQEGPVTATGKVIVPPPGCTFGVISDLDDTVIRTHATNWRQMARLTFLGNAHTRMPFDGVAAFYQALQEGVEGEARHPFFYVSSSPWNLYDLLVDFLELQTIPKGPLLLRDLGLDENKFIKTGHGKHKTAQIERVFDTYPDLPFVLVGDSGQRDPEIYRDVAKRHPDRVTAIYIRDVTTPARDREVHAIADEVEEATGIAMVLVDDSRAAAEHAAEHGLIRPDAIDAVEGEVAEAQTKTS
jgi:phosphatidate phosphatase APP1